MAGARHRRLLLLGAFSAVIVAGLFAAWPAPGAERAPGDSRAFGLETVAGGNYHSCALLGNGSVRCWGDSSSGKLGYGNTTTIGDDETPGSAGPVDLGTGRSAVAIAAGEQHTCALLDNGGVRCWGEGSDGQLGYANTDDIGDDETPGSVGPVDLGSGRSAVAISAGGLHTCALLDNGGVRCWGWGGDGRLGYGNGSSIGDDETPGSVGPVDLGTGRSAVAIGAGGAHSCALLDNGSVRCWGDGNFGRLGYGNQADIGDDETPGSVGPVDLGTGRSAVAISAGLFHTCAVLDNGSSRCWGDGIHGELGYGNTTTIGDDETPGSVGPVDLGTGRSAVAISAGYFHTCAVLDNGSVRCWGYGGQGALGYGNGSNIGDDEAPGSVGPVDLGSGRSAIAIDAGVWQSCAVLDNGEVRCWGDGTSGQLGYGNTTTIGDDETPGSVGPVDVGLAPGGRERSASAGDYHSCALLDSGSVRCWGLADDGQLGYGNTSEIGDSEAPALAGPVDLGAGRSAGQVTAGDYHTCALLDNGTVRCWGFGNFGRLGYGNTTTIGDDETPGSFGPVNLGTGRSAKQISAGVNHTCALLDNGTVRCWGNGGLGQLGYGNTADIGDNETPGSVGPVDLGTGRTAVAIDAGEWHTCALLDNGSVRCWGEGTFGALGYGNTNNIGDNETPGSAGPVDLGTGRSAVAISAGNIHTCAVLDNGAVRCWGNGGEGRLGYGNTAWIGDDEAPGSVGPVDLGAGRSATTISAGFRQTCARLDDGSLRCWGEGSFGKLGYAGTANVGDNETPGSASPVDLGVGRTATSVSTGRNHTCARLDNGRVRCWGLGDFGRLGYANTLTIGDDEVPGAAGPVDLAPASAAADSKTVTEDDTATAVDVLANDIDPDGGPIAIQSASDPAHGTVAVTGGGAGLTYQPDPDYAGSDGFTYTLVGGSTATVSVTVTAVDDPPVAVDDAATVAENAPASAIGVLANDADIDGGPITIQSASDPAHGTVAVTGGGAGLTYQPDAGYCNDAAPADTFTYALNGGSSASVAMTVTCSGPPADTDPPETTITKKPRKKTGKRKAKFKFVSDEPGSAFQCKLDKKRLKPCTSPKKVKVKRGKKHKFRVQAIDPAGNVDPTPAKARWKVRR